MRVPDVLHVTRSTARGVGFHRGRRGFVENLGVVTLAARRARIRSIDICAHVARLVTTAARQNLGAILVRNSINTGNDANVIEMDTVELRVPPLFDLS